MEIHQMSAWKQIVLLFAVAALLPGLCGCESGAGTDEIAISGDSGLLVKNEMLEKAVVVFDDDLIGYVDALGSRFWQVPSGRHRIQVGPNSDDIDFKPGKTVTLIFHSL
jgi:hypothetical protein